MIDLPVLLEIKSQLAIAKTLHVLSFVIWIGGMFFAHNALRPVVTILLKPSQRLPLMSQVLNRFTAWVWLALILLWISGVWLILLYGGMAKVQPYVHAMMLLATIMTFVFLYLVFGALRGLKQSVANKDLKSAAKFLARVRWVIFTNLSLGLLTIMIAIVGK
jgi:uncharacterized membrane protein